MSGRIFLSYRREDSGGQTGRLADRLVAAFGKDNLFLDIDSIPLGVNFRKELEDAVAACDVLIAPIGPRWLDMRNARNERRIDQPDDYVRIEIAAALQRKITVIPALIDGTVVPSKELLPDDVKDLADQNGIEIRYKSFHADVDHLIRELRKILPPAPPTPTGIRGLWTNHKKFLIISIGTEACLCLGYFVYTMTKVPLATSPNGFTARGLANGHRTIAKYITLDEARANSELGPDFLCFVDVAVGTAGTVHHGVPPIGRSIEVIFSVDEADVSNDMRF